MYLQISDILLKYKLNYEERDWYIVFLFPKIYGTIPFQPNILWDSSSFWNLQCATVTRNLKTNGDQINDSV